MHCDRIPAPVCGVTPEQMSSREFQEKLYAWFEENGLIADLRSYLRLQMIRRLRNTSVGKLEPKNAVFSLPQQAFNLVIAEHLLREGCHYTLSVFSTEIPSVANQMPFSLFETARFKENLKWRFDQDSVENVLELLGIKKGSVEGARVRSLYLKNFGSLLSCIVSRKHSKTDVYKAINIENKGDVESLTRYLVRILSSLGLSKDAIADVNHQIHLTIQEEVKKSRVSHDRNSAEMKSQLAERDAHIKRLVDEQIALSKQIKQLQCDYKQARKRANELTLKEDTIRMKEAILKDKFDEVSKLEDDLRRQFEKEASCNKIHCMDQCQNNAFLVEKLRKEVEELQDVNKKKTLDVERTSSRCVLLSADLKNSQAKIEFLQSCLARSSQINLNERSESELELSDDSSEHFTDQILQQVKERLQNLEKESEELDLRFQRLKIK